MLRTCLNNRRGFSLVEIMIVLGIIGTILALVGNQILGGKEKADRQAAKTQLTQLTNALNTYESDCGKLPGSLDALMKNTEDCSNWGPKPYYQGKSGKILDPWNGPFDYQPSDDGTFVLRSLGKDKAQGGTGVNQDISLDEGTAE